MRLFFDRRLGYLVTAPGQESALSGLTGKAGDTAEVQIVFGRSSDPTGAASIIESPTWTPENLAGGTVITIGIKEDGDYSDGTLLAGTSSFSLHVPTNTYTFTLPLNTTAINAALLRLDANAANDIASLNCQFEVTYQVGGSGGWESSILPVPFLLYNDVIGGDEGTPTNADDPTEYLLKAAGIEWLPSVTSKIGGTAADIDAIPTVARPLNALVAFLDQDATNLIRVYRLESGTDAESSPNVIRPDDYNGTTNARVWKSYDFGGMTNPMTTPGDIIIGGYAGAAARLPKGDDGQVLKIVSGELAWAPSEEGAGGPTLPVADTTALVKDPITASKQIRIDAGNVPADTTVVLQSPGVSAEVGTVVIERSFTIAVGIHEAAVIVMRAGRMVAVGASINTSGGTYPVVIRIKKNTTNQGAGPMQIDASADGSYGKYTRQTLSFAVAPGDVIGVDIVGSGSDDIFGSGTIGSSAEGTLVVQFEMVFNPS